MSQQTDMKSSDNPLDHDDLKDDEKESKMKAVMCVAIGQVDFSKSIKLKSVVKPINIKPNEVMIEIYAGAINPVDYKMAIGNLGFMGPNKPYIVGRDFCGIIKKIGSNVTNYKIGDAVFGKTGNGSFCEYIVIENTFIKHIPSNMTFSESAGLTLVGMTSYEALIIRAKLKKDDKLLILGGSTSCGMMGIQIAKYIGCDNITVTSTQKDLCESLGAKQVINYKQSDWRTVLKGEKYNVVYDCIGGDIWIDICKIMHRTGYFVSICGDDPDATVNVTNILNIGWNVLKRKSSNLFGGSRKYDLFLLNSDPTNFKYLIKMVKENKLKVIMDKSIKAYNMNNCHEMFEKSRTHSSHGKLIIKIKDYDENKTIKQLGFNTSNNDDINTNQND